MIDYHSAETRLRRNALEGQGKCVEQIVALLVQGREIGTNGAEGFEAGCGAEAARDFLFDLGHAHIALGDIVGEGNTVIGHETPDIVGMDAQAVEQIERLALLGSAALAGRRSARVGGFSVGNNPGMGTAIVRDAIFRQRPADRRHLTMRLDQQIDQALCPDLTHLLEDVGQFAQVVSIAQAVRATQIAVRLPAIVNQRTRKCGENTEGIEGLSAPVHVSADPGQRGGGQDMQPAERACHAHTGLVGMGDGNRFERLTHRQYDGSQKRSGFLMDRQHRGIGHRQPEEIARQRASARHRHHVMVGQMHHGGFDSWPVLHRRRNCGGKLAPVHFPAEASRFEHPVLGDLVTQGRDVEYLAGFGDHRAGQRAMADIAMVRRRVCFDMIRLRDFLQGVSGVPFLSTGRLLSRPALRLRLGLAHTVRGWWFAGVAAVLRQTPFKFGNLGCQRSHLREQRTDQVVFLGNAEVVKIGQGFHACLYRLPLPFLKPGIAMLLRNT